MFLKFLNKEAYLTVKVQDGSQKICVAVAYI